MLLLLLLRLRLGLPTESLSMLSKLHLLMHRLLSLEMVSINLSDTRGTLLPLLIALRRRR